MLLQKYLDELEWVPPVQSGGTICSRSAAVISVSAFPFLNAQVLFALESNSLAPLPQPNLFLSLFNSSDFKKASTCNPNVIDIYQSFLMQKAGSFKEGEGVHVLTFAQGFLANCREQLTTL